MAKDSQLSPAAQEDFERPSRRLLKTWQNAELVRRMDEIIISSRGAYSDRSEFLAEAIRDRLEAEEERAADEEANGTGPDRTAGAPTAEQATSLPDLPNGADRPLPTNFSFGDWLDRDAPALPVAPGPTTNFGMHNRDWPTLIAADWLGRMTAERGEPISWRHYTEAIIPWAWEYGAMLQQQDLDRPRGAKVAAGFPTNRKKPEATEARFRDHFLGTIDRRGNRGPLFVFGMVGLEGDRAALSEPGRTLIQALRKAGVASGPPFPPKAWKAFAEHLRQRAPDELETWRRVLEIVATKPDRQTLVSRCSWWKGAAADTNSMSLIARGREWGLVELALDEGRHDQLTDLGARTLRDEKEGATPP
jgi:Arc/MetJ-type ribon-helix-helix transcriptional regulator